MITDQNHKIDLYGGKQQEKYDGAGHTEIVNTGTKKGHPKAPEELLAVSCEQVVYKENFHLS